MEVETIPLRCELNEPFGFAQGWYESRENLIVKITTAEGIEGFGECFGPIKLNKEAVESLLTPLLLGERVFQTKRLWRKMYRSLRASFQTFVPLTALSGVDVALWDAKAKLMDRPLGDLLGGRVRDRVSAYATGHYFKRTDSLQQLLELIVEEAKKNVKEGFSSIKLKLGLEKIGFSVEDDLKLVNAVREELGEDTGIMVDANYAYSRLEAERVGRALENCDIKWFEEPISPDDFEGMRQLRGALSIPVAAGECLGPEGEFLRLFEEEAVDIVQPDICTAGGITVMENVLRVAEAKGIKLIPHVWGTPVATAANLQIMSTFESPPLLELDRSQHPIRTELREELLTIDGSQVWVPSRPGLGLGLKEELLRDINEKYE